MVDGLIWTSLIRHGSPFPAAHTDESRGRGCLSFFCVVVGKLLCGGHTDGGSASHMEPLVRLAARTLQLWTLCGCVACAM